MTSPPRTSLADIPTLSWQRLIVAGRGRSWAAALALITCFSLLLPEPGPLPGLRNFGFDTYQKLWPRVRSAQPVVIVAIDDRSLQQVGQWPWPRDTMARLVGEPPKLDAFLKGERSLPRIDSAAAGRGLFNAHLDNGVVRRVPLVASRSSASFPTHRHR